MCTALSFLTKAHYFGRNLDLEYSVPETVVVMPRHYPFPFRHMGTMNEHYAMIGIAWVESGFPLFYDATNEKGLSMAGLNFPGNADYKPYAPEKDNVTPFEFIPWLLGQCATVDEAKALLGKMNLENTPYSATLPLSPLHWIIADRNSAITVECVREGLRVYDNPVGVLTNNPTFDYHMTNLNNYMALGANQPANTFAPALPLQHYSNGMGGLGMPGDWSSTSRFVRATFAKLNAVCEEDENSSVSQFFRMLGAVSFPRGCVRMKDGSYEITIYSSCCNTDTGVYYYITYENTRICAVDMHAENLDGSELAVHPMATSTDVFYHTPQTQG